MRFAAIGAIATLALLPVFATIPATATPAGLPSHHGNPSASQLQASRNLVSRRLAQVRAAEGRLDAAETARGKADSAAEIAAEAYDGAAAKLQVARKAVSADQTSLAAANLTVTRKTKAASRFAVAAYENAGLSSFDAVVDSGPADAIGKLGTVQAISIGQNQALQKLQAAEIVQASVARQAQQAQTAAAQAATEAQQAFSSARRLADAAERQVRTVQRTKQRLNTLLSEAESHASRLREQHIEALAAAARAAAAAAAARAADATTSSAPSPYSGTSGNLGGTITAAEGEQAVSIAESQIGKPYQWAAAGPDSYDCSGLTMWTYDHLGVHLEHYTGDQWTEGAHVSVADLRPGDLVFFATDTSDAATIHHVGIYVGDGNMVNAPETGEDVEISPATSRPDYIGAVRPYRS